MTGDGEQRGWPLLVSVFLISFSVLAFEVSLTRVFSVLLKYHYAFLVVSGAVCGLGLGGFGWHLIGRRREFQRMDAGWAALGFALLMPGTILLFFGSSSLVSANLSAAFLMLLPFTLAGAFLSEVFRQGAADSGRLYQVDLAGAAIAAVLIVPLIGFVGALDLVFLLGATAALGAASWGFTQRNPRLLWTSIAAGLLLFGSWPLSANTRLLRLRPLAAGSPTVQKPMVRDLAGDAITPIIVDSEWTAYARTDFIRYPVLGESAYTLQLFTDGGTPAIMTPFKGGLDQVAYLREDLPYLAFDLSPHTRLLSIGPGGGMDFLWGLLAGYEDLEGVEINDSMVRLMDRYRRVNGDLYHYPGVRVTLEDGRSFIRRARRQYDLISSSLTQTATTDNAGLCLVESYIHTKEAFDDYYRHLTPDGRFALVTQSDLLLLRAGLTALAVMQDRGIDPWEGCQHLITLALPSAEKAPSPYRYLLIWKKSLFVPQDLASIKRAIESGAVQPLFVPGSGGEPVLEKLSRKEATLDQIISRGITEDGARVNIRPATDDRPFFLDLSPGVPRVLKWLLLVTLGAAALFSIVFLSSRAREGPSVRPLGTWIFYFSALGAGFMLVEIPLIQKLILLLGHPTRSLAMVICCLLIGASLGSRWSQSWPLRGLARRIALASVVVSGLVVIYVIALAAIVAACQGWPLPARLALLGALMLPLGIVLGIPFPSGLRLMSARWQAEIPWMWGINGIMSVAGSAFAAAAGRVVGFSGCLLLAAVIYAGVAASARHARVFAAPEARVPPRPPRRRVERPHEQRLMTRPSAALVIVAFLALVVAAVLWTPPAGPESQTSLSGGRELWAAYSSQDWTPLHYAAFKGDPAETGRLLAQGADMNARSQSALGWTPLHEAASAGHDDVLKLLLTHGADPQATDARGCTPLHSAAWMGQLSAAELLVAQGADVNARDAEGKTPLHYAATMGRPRLLSLLISAGGDLSAKDATALGWTPLHFAVLRGHPDSVAVLLTEGAEANNKDNDGRTPLHLAAWSGQRDLAELLLAHRADADTPDNGGKTPAALADERGHRGLAELLRERAGAE